MVQNERLEKLNTLNQFLDTQVNKEGKKERKLLFLSKHLYMYTYVFRKTISSDRTSKKAQFAHNHIKWIINLFWLATCWLIELLHRGKVEFVFAEELHFPGRSLSDSLLFSSLCPAGLIDETTLCSSDHHSHSLKKRKKNKQKKKH